MYPRGLYGNPQRPNQLFGRDGFLRNIPNPEGEGISEAHALAFNLRATLNRIARALEPILPDDCPVIFGGGLIRDGIMGAEPGDIDVWLPSNLDHTAVDFSRFQRHLQIQRLVSNHLGITPVFHAPAGIALAVTNEGNPYRDMTNHWVGQTEVNGYPVQFMRTNVVWENDPQEFMNRLMRNFDLFECMFFMCVQRGQSVDEDPTTQFVVIPEDMAVFLSSDAGVWDTLGWNSLRNVTSEERRRARIEKLQRKYIIGDAEEFDGNGLRAMPCPVSVLIDNIDKFPLPRQEVNNGGTAREVLPTETPEVDWDAIRFPNGTTITFNPAGDPFQGIV